MNNDTLGGSLTSASVLDALETADVTCNSLVVDNNIECNSIAADGAVVVGGLLTAKNISCNASGTDGNATVKKLITSSPLNEVGGIVLGPNDKVTLPTSYATLLNGSVQLPEDGQLGNIKSATLNSTTVLTVGYDNIKQFTGPSGIPYALTLSPGIYIVTVHLELHNGSIALSTTNFVQINTQTTGASSSSVYRNVPNCVKGGGWLASTTFFAFPNEETTYSCNLYVSGSQTYGVDGANSMFRAMRIG